MSFMRKQQADKIKNLRSDLTKEFNDYLKNKKLNKNVSTQQISKIIEEMEFEITQTEGVYYYRYIKKSMN